MGGKYYVGSSGSEMWEYGLVESCELKRHFAEMSAA
jgi:hypothetical protein